MPTILFSAPYMIPFVDRFQPVFIHYGIDLLIPENVEERMEEADILAIYGSIGTVLKHWYSGHEAWILSGNPGALKHVGLKPDRRKDLFNGPIRCKFHHYTLYEGSKKSK